jgi:hypothetical protein
MSFLPAVKLWIWISVLASLAGWLLSLVAQLSFGGYLVFAFVALVVIAQLLAAQRAAAARPPVGRWRKMRRRFSRGFPLMFAALAVLVFLGGLLYPPTNHTALSYRIPRVLHWLDARQWNWIYTANYRMNVRACGIEWLSAPLLLFTRSDRFLFLLNFFPFLLLPGLTFSVLTRLGVRTRVAWHWMWLLPTGYVFLLQAGSAGNDAFPTIYVLAAIDFACRAWSSRRAGDIWYSLLSIALLTGAKASNLPLVLPWLVLIVPVLPVLRTRLPATAGVVFIAALVSFLPTAILNLIHIHSWSGLKLEHSGMEMKNPFVGIWGNIFLLVLNNLCPPFFPLAEWWNHHALQLIPGPIVHPLVRNFETGFHNLGELPTEDWTGIGPGIAVLMLVSAIWALRNVQRSKFVSSLINSSNLFNLINPFNPSNFSASPQPIPPAILRLSWICSWIALLAYCAKSGMVTPARLIAPYYPLLLPPLLADAAQSLLVRRNWWRKLSWAVFAFAFAVLVLTPARPFWPAKTILGRAVALQPDSRLLKRALAVYSVYSIRYDPVAEVRSYLPRDLKVVGLLSSPDDLETPFWRPYGKRRVEQISWKESAENIRARNLQYAVVSKAVFLIVKEGGAEVDEWLARTQAEVIGRATVTVTLTAGAQEWLVVRFKDLAATSANSVGARAPLP